MDSFKRTAQRVTAPLSTPQVMLLLVSLVLLLLGFVMIYSASSVSAIGSETATPEGDLVDQLKYAVIGVVLMVIVWRFVPYSIWNTWIVAVPWAISVVLILATMVAGSAANGAQRWLVLGPISLQPSEFAKIAFVLFAAFLLYHARNGSWDRNKIILYVVVGIVAPLGLMYRAQSDLGSTLICAAGIFAVLWIGEVRMRSLLAILAGVVVFAIIAIAFVGYRSDRFLFLNPWDDGEDGYGKGYQIIHSYFALAEGGLFGVGLGNSHEKYKYLLESQNDLIFAVIGDELGLVGALLVIALFMLFLYAGLRIAQSAQDNFGATVAGGCTIMLVTQAFVNIGSVIGAFPTTGKPLPFISAGGSSLIATLIIVGLIMSVSIGAPDLREHDRRRANLRVVRAQEVGQPSPTGGRSGGGRHAFRASDRTTAQARQARGRASGESRTARSAARPGRR